MNEFRVDVAGKCVFCDFMMNDFGKELRREMMEMGWIWVWVDRFFLFLFVVQLFDAVVQILLY